DDSITSDNLESSPHSPDPEDRNVLLDASASSGRRSRHPPNIPGRVYGTGSRIHQCSVIAPAVDFPADIGPPEHLRLVSQSILEKAGARLQRSNMTGLRSKGNRAAANEATVDALVTNESRDVLDGIQCQPEHGRRAFRAQAAFQLLHFGLVPRQNEAAV